MDCPELRAGATLVLPVSHDGAGLYFGDSKALMGDSEIVGPPEVQALITASAEPRQRPASMGWPRLESATTLTTLVSGRPLEWSARAGLPRAPGVGRRGLRDRAAEGGAADGDGRARGHLPDQQHRLHRVLRACRATRSRRTRARASPCASGSTCPPSTTSVWPGDVRRLGRGQEAHRPAHVGGLGVAAHRDRGQHQRWCSSLVAARPSVGTLPGMHGVDRDAARRPARPPPSA